MNQSGNVQRDHRFADRRAADLQQTGQIAVRGQALSGFVFAVLDQSGKLFGHLAVQGGSGYGMDGHEKCLSVRFLPSS